ncbi:MAG: glycoside hydrolase family 43 protein [Mangrovibacterium sp.]
MKIKSKIYHLKYITSIILLSSMVSCQFGLNKQHSTNFKPGKKWLDTDSIHINAHGGGVLHHDNTYYWFGEYKVAGKGGNAAQVGVSCYSSKDLYNWKNEGTALNVSETKGSDIERGCIIERPKVIYNKKTDKFVMWFHLELKGKGYEAARTGLAVADKATGPYIFVKSLRPNIKQWPLGYIEELKLKKFRTDMEWWTPEWYKQIEEGMFVNRDFEGGQMSRDMGLFVDDDGKAYHIHSSEDNLTIHIAELTDDYQGFTGKYIRIAPAGHNEAPALFKHKGTYYLITSGCTGWDPNAARLFEAKSIWGPWVSAGNPCVGKDAELTFHSQSTYVLPMPGKEDAFIYMGDRWQPQNPIDGTYVWLPITFKHDQPVIKWYDEWSLEKFQN